MTDKPDYTYSWCLVRTIADLTIAPVPMTLPVIKNNVK